MTDSEYHSHPAISREDLLLLAKSPALFHAVKSGGLDAEEVRKVFDELDPASRKRDAFEIGEATHRTVFEPETVEQRFRIIPADVLSSAGTRSGANWKYFDAHCRSAGQVPITAGRLALARMLAASARRTLGPLLAPDAIHEQPLFWNERVEVDGREDVVECRGKPDFISLSRNGRKAVVIDLKTCPSLEDFARSIKRWRYWMQQVHYEAGVESKYGCVPLFYFAAVEKRAPFHCQLFRIDGGLAEARTRRKELLQELVRRRRDDNWTDPEQTGIQTVNVQVL